MPAMADDNKLVAEPREQFGKGFARRIRAAGKIPAVIYGHGTDPQHVTLPGHEVALILRKANQVLELDISVGQGHLFGEPRAIKEAVLAETDPPADFIRSTLRSADHRRRFG